jgi:hypothetical protein
MKKPVKVQSIFTHFDVIEAAHRATMAHNLEETQG